MLKLQNTLLSCCFDETTGQLRSIRKGELLLPFEGLGFDFGCNEQMATGLLEYESMLEFRAWNLPAIKPTGKVFSLVPEELSFKENRISVTYRLSMGTLTITYTLLNDSLKADMTLTNTGNETLYLNTCGFVLRLAQIDGVTFDYPANAPIYHCESSRLEKLNAVQTGLINFATHFNVPGGDLNVMFIDSIEKWGCGTYRDDTATCQVYHAGLEMDLTPGDSCHIGSLYIQPCAPASEAYAGDGNPYLMIRHLVERLGFAPCNDGIYEGVMYSCHPTGTMDKDFPLKTDLFEYADYLPVLKEMGVDHVWLLPVFENVKGVYHSIDQSVIDKRYGGEEGCKYYCDRAHELGMTILFDYVPHGPAPEFPLAKDNPEWPSKRRDGSLQDEWECVSMDYNHPGYQEYTAELVHDHVKRFGVDGSRIDCAMGGLSNWRPFKENRPSGNSVLAGVHITESIRNGFLRGGKPSFILPENFNPLPNYYHTTDLFYGMNLYRAFVDLESLLHTDPAAYAEGLSDFLEREAWITPADYHKLRFLGNHDTVSWVWQCSRAADCYGAEAAKALFAVISLIDGMPMIYQGDEDPSIYEGTTENLTSYFKKLFHDRKTYLPAGSNETTYLHTKTPLMAFIREPKENGSVSPASAPYASKGHGRVLVLVNLSAETQSFDLSDYKTELLSQGNVSEPAIPGQVPAYSYQIFQL